MRLKHRPVVYSLIAGLAVLVSIAALACEGASDDEELSASCGSFNDIDSYRYSISVKMNLPGLQAAGPTPGPALSPYATQLAALLSDFQIEGAYVAPDRRQAVLSFLGDQLEVREVGQRRWERFGETWRSLGMGTPAVHDLSPEVVCSDLLAGLAPGLAQSTSDEEEVNGVLTQRYTMDETKVDQLSTLLGLEVGAELPAQFRVDVWLASDGGWPARLDIRSQTADAQLGAGAVQLVMELRDVNNPGILIDTPPGVSGG
jgi:hypothetical protein